MAVRPRTRLAAVLSVCAVAAAVLGIAGSSGVAAGADAPTQPTRVLIVLFDQMRPEYADRFDMQNFKQLQAGGTSFRNAYLGYMASETVISHNVIVSGQRPNHMGWVDEAYRDSGNLLAGGANNMWITGDLTLGQFDTLVNNQGYKKLSDYLQPSLGGKFITVGEKSYAVESAAAGADNPADIAVRLSSRTGTKAADLTKPPPFVPDACSVTLGGQYRFPSGRNVPAYLSDPCGRYFINSDKSNDYGTLGQFPSRIYPEDGNRFFPGTDPNHLGGDVWVADAAMAMMENETDWSGMFVTMGGIDKAGHMWGADQDVQPALDDIGYQTHVEAAAKIADAQLGRMIDKLRELGQLDDTLIVLTADHGGTHGGTNGAQFYGQDFASAGDTNWYYGNSINDGLFNNPSPALKPLIDTGNVQFSYQSTAIETWLINNGQTQKLQAAAAMKTLPGVMATYYRNGTGFTLASTGTMSSSERSWWKDHAQSIVNGLAASNGPDVVGLLRDDVSYGAFGDHGGASEEVQRVPVVFYAPGFVQVNNSGKPFTTPDILPTILKALGIKAGPMDGKGVGLN